MPPSNAEIAALTPYANAQKAARTNVALICTSQSRTMPRLLSCLFTYSPKFHRANYNATRMNNQRPILFANYPRKSNSVHNERVKRVEDAGFF
ncbi:hypothetical protein Lgra_1302 [Legionella gratiana]|uniref:Uncharacterized protein n=1 Tax=Legionella gratiana TaxID=45066 RepID=A0ABR5R6G1_9GAMM|nr:hypothetical protein Lgra_1302 [Legionella gratiana]